MYEPGIEPELVDQLCDVEKLVPMPLGYLTSLPAVVARRMSQVAQVGTTAPVLLTWADHEAPWTPEQRVAEETLWRTTCGCDLTVWTSALWVEQVVEWLAARGITTGGSRTGGPPPPPE